MPYINIKEEDIQTIQGFDQINNAVMIFGFNFKLQNGNRSAKEVKNELGFEYKLYTSLNEFVNDIKSSNTSVSFADTNMRRAAFRPYITAYDCLANGLPVIYVPIDNKIPDEAILIPVNSESVSYVAYDWLSEPDSVTDRSDSFWDNISNADDAYNYYINGLDSEGSEGPVAPGALNIPRILKDYIEVDELSGGLDFGDKINFPVTFITTCGFEDFRYGSSSLAANILDRFKGRLDLLYLYDLPADTEPKDIITNSGEAGQAGAIAIPRGEVTNIVYPWGHYNSYNGVTGIHMPGSYGYLMAYAISIKSNNPWFAVAGVTRGVIPNIVDVDYKISEAFIHNFQGDEGSTVTLNFKINPIVDFGPNYGKIIFGNRTCLAGNGTDLPFRSFLNIRLLLIYIHKQAFASSIQHMFEPNDDIVWLSFKQKVNLLLDKMVSGRGIKWYKWAKIRSDKLGEIRARLTIRPIEAVESFDIIIRMTDTDIDVSVATEV